MHRHVESHLADCEACRELIVALGGELGQAAAPVRTRAGITETLEEPSIGLGSHFALTHGLQRVGTTLLDKWTLDELIGVGGTAQVFAARHRNGHRVAIKVLRPEFRERRKHVAGFLREGYVANRVDHPGAVPVLDDGIAEDGAPFLVMPLLDGETLASRLRKSGRMDRRVVRNLGLALLDVLAAAHAKGIVHRDIKPANLFLLRDGSLRVLDFGIAQMWKDEAMGTPQVVAGTPGFMAPEQLHDAQAIGPATDLWAVGATLFGCVAGEPLEKSLGPSGGHIMAKEQLPSTAKLSPHVGPLAPALDRALRHHANERYRSAEEMRAALLALSMPSRRTRWVRFAVAAAIASVALSGVAATLRSSAQEGAAKGESRRVFVGTTLTRASGPDLQHVLSEESANAPKAKGSRRMILRPATPVVEPEPDPLDQRH